MSCDGIPSAIASCSGPLSRQSGGPALPPSRQAPPTRQGAGRHSPHPPVLGGSCRMLPRLRRSTTPPRTPAPPKRQRPPLVRLPVQRPPAAANPPVPPPRCAVSWRQLDCVRLQPRRRDVRYSTADERKYFAPFLPGQYSPKGLPGGTASVDCRTTQPGSTAGRARGFVSGELSQYHWMHSRLLCKSIGRILEVGSLVHRPPRR
jgi:hypothetical protein